MRRREDRVRNHVAADPDRLTFCNARQMTSPEAYIHFTPEVFTDDGEVLNEGTAEFLSTFMREFRDYIQMVLTVLPRN